MRLNSIKPANGSKRAAKRVGRGIGSGHGKTAGRGHKGQKSRSGGYHKVGFEGGQMPLQRRLPKVGFRSYLARITGEIRLDELDKAGSETIDLDTLRKAGLVSRKIKRVKIIASGAISRAVTVKGLRASKAARAAIETAGGKFE